VFVDTYFVADQQTRDRISVGQHDLLVQIPLPLFDRGETVATAQVEQNNGAGRVLIVDSGDVATSLLPAYVPQLQFDRGVCVPLQSLHSKVHADLHSVRTQKRLWLRLEAEQEEGGGG
jgi:hypothetical protein